ncbi:MAG: hypothetical protein M3457_15935 [Chloroflexota bacterium]|nr:hypothetical protein [Chloroflexota bacterium]
MSKAFTFERMAVQVFQEAVNEIASKLESFDDANTWFGRPVEDFRDHILDQWMLHPLEWDPKRNQEVDRDDAIYMGRRPPKQGGPEIRRLFLPLIPRKSNFEVLLIRPEQGWTERGPSLSERAAFDAKESVLLLRGTLEELEQLRHQAGTIINLINQDVLQHFAGLPGIVNRMIQGRYQLITASQLQFEADAKALNVDIRTRSNAPAIVDVRERAEIEVVRNLDRKAAKVDDPQLSNDSIRRIIGLLDQAGRGFEFARKEFRSLGEEGLRHVLVGYLNAVFESTAVTGETFSKDGKPDLVVMVQGQPVLVGECKFWGGKALYSKTLHSQLTRYVLWRHAIAVMITFSDRKNLTAVIKDASSSTQASRPQRDQSMK